MKRSLSLLFVLAVVSVQAQAPLPNAWTFREIFQGKQMAYSPDGQFLAVGAPGAIQVYSPADLQPIKGINTNVSTLASMIFSPDSKTMLVAGNYANGTGWVELWNVSTGKLTSSFQSDAGGVTAASFSPDGKSIAVAGGNGKNNLLDIFQLSNHALVTAFATKLTAINSVAFTPSGYTLAAGGSVGTQGSTELWNLPSKKLITTLDSEAPTVTQVVISLDGNYLATGGTVGVDSGAKVEMYSLATNAEVVSFPSTAQDFVGMAFTPDSLTLVTTGETYVPNMDGGNWDAQFESWSVPYKNLISSSLQGYGSWATAMSPDGTTIATSGLGYITVPHFTVGDYGFLAKTRVASFSLEAQSITGSTGMLGEYRSPGPAFAPPVFSPDGLTLIGGGLNAWSGTASLWNSVTGEWLGSVPNPNHSFGSAFAYAPDGKSYAAAYSGTIEVFSSKDNSQVSSFTTTLPTISSMKYSPDGTTIAIGGLNNVSQESLGIWNVKTGSLVCSMNSTAFGEVNEFDFSPDGKTLVSGGRQSSTTQTTPVVELWNTTNGSLIASLKTECSAVLCTKFSPNGKLIAVGGSPGAAPNNVSLELWDPIKKTLIGSLPVAFNTSSITSVVFTPNSGQLLASSTIGIQEFTVASRTLDGYTGDNAAYVALSSDGTKIAYETAYDGIVSGPYSVPATSQISSLTFNPPIINQGKNSTATVTLAKPAPTGGVSVGLFSPDPYHFPIPSIVFIPAGQRSASTTIATPYAYGPSYLITAVNGSSVKSATLTVRSATIGLFSFSPDTIVGGTSTTGTVTIDEPAGPKGAVITLSSSNSYLIVPATVTIPAGKQTVTFTAKSTKVTSSGEAVVWASWNNSTVTSYVIVQPGT
jgi:WD40 repeat protein